MTYISFWLYSGFYDFNTLACMLGPPQCKTRKGNKGMDYKIRNKTDPICRRY